MPVGVGVVVAAANVVHNVCHAIKIKYNPTIFLAFEVQLNVL